MLFFWGYREHIIWGGDDDVQLPLMAKVYPNNVMDETVAPTLFRKLKKNYHIKKVAFFLFPSSYSGWQMSPFHLDKCTIYR